MDVSSLTLMDCTVSVASMAPMNRFDVSTVRHVVIDIEGTTSSTAFVHGVLFPYARAEMAGWIAAHRGEPRVIEQLAAVRVDSGEPDADDDRIVWWLHHWIDTDAKVTSLKALQGWIWDEGFSAGRLTSHFFDDVIDALRRWHERGRMLSIFSSGSVSAQRAWFSHTPEGSLLDLFDGRFFDTANAGPKREVASYQRIARLLGAMGAVEDGLDAAQVDPRSIVFLSDVTAELDAARQAGWHTVGVRRHGDVYFDAGVGDHEAITSFDELDL
jgi:enolase-phosphatase E1